jgi:hypothetical protein
VKARSVWPALLALGGLIALYLVVRGREDSATPVKQPSTSPPKTAHSTPSAPRAPVAPAATAQPAHDEDEGHDEDAVVLTKPNKPAPTPTTQTPPVIPRKPNLTLDEKLARAQKHIVVMERRATLLEKEIEALDNDGKKQEAADQRIVLKRLHEHTDELRAAIAERREPM